MMRRSYLGFFIVLLLGFVGFVIFQYSIGRKPKLAALPVAVQNAFPSVVMSPTARARKMRTIETKYWSMDVPYQWHYIDCVEADSLWVGQGIQKDETSYACNGPFDANLILFRQSKKQLPKIPYSDASKPLAVEDYVFTIDGRKAIDRGVYSNGKLLTRSVYIEQPTYTDTIRFRTTETVLKKEILGTLQFK